MLESCCKTGAELKTDSQNEQNVPTEIRLRNI